jgi:probable HAF family extracellular repeat protein
VNSNGAQGTVAVGINDHDQIVGYYYDSNDHANGFLYSNGKYTTLDDPLGVDGTFATGINNKGQIVGYYQDLNGTHGFVYSGGTYTNVEDPLGGSNALGINNNGQIVGYYGGADRLVHGFVATPVGAHSLATSSVQQAAPSFGSTVSPSATRTIVMDPPVSGSLTPSANGSAAGSTDLFGVSFGPNTTLGYSSNSGNTGGTLTANDGLHAHSVALLAQYMASSFVMPSAGHGGTMITESPSNQQPLLAHPHA